MENVASLGGTVGPHECPLASRNRQRALRRASGPNVSFSTTLLRLVVVSSRLATHLLALSGPELSNRLPGVLSLALRGCLALLD